MNPPENGYLQVRTNISHSEGEPELYAALENENCRVGGAATAYGCGGCGIGVLSVSAQGEHAMRELAASLKTIVARIESYVGEVQAKPEARNPQKIMEGIPEAGGAADLPKRDLSRYITTREACEQLGISKSALMRRIQKGLMHAEYEGGRYLIPASEIDRLKAEAL